MKKKIQYNLNGTLFCPYGGFFDGVEDTKPRSQKSFLKFTDEVKEDADCQQTSNSWTSDPRDTIDEKLSRNYAHKGREKYFLCRFIGAHSRLLERTKRSFLLLINGEKEAIEEMMMTIRRCESIFNIFRASKSS